ncbi:MAG: hypothetical protein ACFFG0_37390 [Candidatus Thorarchaeota archaeon]
MSENNQVKEEVNWSYIIEFAEYPEEIIKLLKERKITFKAWKTHYLEEEFDDNDEELPFVELEPEIYQKVKKLSEITGISMEDIVSKELGDFFFSVGDQIAIFLDRHLGIENIKNPIETIRNLQDLFNIPKRYVKSLKGKEDLIKEIEDFKRI